MTEIEKILEYQYEDLLQYVKNNPNIIKDKRIKEKLIITNDKYEFYEVLRTLNINELLILLDDTGIECLKQSKYSDDKINAIITINNELKSLMFQNKTFCSIVTEKMDKLYTSLKRIDIESATYLLQYIKENNPEKTEKILLNLFFPTQEQIIKKIDIPLEVKKSILPYVGGRSAKYILDNTNEINLEEYEFNELYFLISKHMTIPIVYIDNNFLSKITTMYSIKDYRFLLNEFSHSNDSILIENTRKDFYNKELMSYDKENKMLNRFSLCYKELCQLIDEDKISLENLEEVLDKHFNFFGTENDLYFIKHYIYEYFSIKDKEGIKTYLQKESNLQIGNMIIDYHFEDVPYNFFLDIEELLKFQEGEGRTLLDEDINIYNKLLIIDRLTYEEKITLHRTLLEKNWIIRNYELFREAKDKAATLIKEQMLNENSIQKYLDIEQTEKYGVPIYVLDKDPFYAFVKALPCDKIMMLTKEKVTSTVDGASYSLDGSEKLNTYHDPHYAYNIIFSDFPTNQVVHMHLVDSFSKYVRTSTTAATNRVNELLTPKELIEKTSNYNEIVLSQKNTLRENDEVNEKLELPKMLGIYCYDEFLDVDVLSAKELGIGIVVVKTKAYDAKNPNQDHLEQLKISLTENKQYITDFRSDDMAKRRVK